MVDSSSLTKTYYYTLDNVCSVIRITDDTGATAGTYAYDPYGAQTSAEPPSAGANCLLPVTGAWIFADSTTAGIVAASFTGVGLGVIGLALIWCRYL